MGEADGETRSDAGPALAESFAERSDQPEASPTVVRDVVTRTFSAFSDRNFRWFWGGRLSATAAFQVRNVVRGWLVYSLTGSAQALSWVGVGWSVATLVVSPLGGAASDRVRKRDLLIAGQALSAAVLFGIGLLISAGAIRLWHLVVSSLLLGGIFAFMMPARQAFLSEMVSRRVLLNAMALSALGMALMGMVSSAIGGVLIDATGAAPAYFSAALLYTVTIGAYVRLPAIDGASSSANSLRSDLVEGTRYLLRQRTLVALMALELCRVVFYMPYRTFFPVFASDVFATGAVGLGLLSAMASVGGLIGSLIVAVLGDVKWKGQLLLGAGGLSGLGLILFAQAPSFALALVWLLLVNLGGNAYMVTRSTLLQTLADRQMRGRVVSFSRLVWGLMPLGTLPAGALVDAFGVRLTVTAEGIIIALIFGVVALTQPRLQQLR